MKAFTLTVALSIAAVSAMAETEVSIAKGMPYVTVDTPNGPVEIRRFRTLITKSTVNGRGHLAPAPTSAYNQTRLRRG